MSTAVEISFIVEMIFFVDRCKALEIKRGNQTNELKVKEKHEAGCIKRFCYRHYIILISCCTYANFNQILLV